VLQAICENNSMIQRLLDLVEGCRKKRDFEESPTPVA